MRMRRTKTSATVAKSRVELMPSNAALASAENPAGPVAFVSTVRGRLAASVDRIASTASTSTSTSPFATIGIAATAAFPLRE